MNGDHLVLNTGRTDRRWLLRSRIDSSVWEFEFLRISRPEGRVAQDLLEEDTFKWVNLS